MGDSEHPNKRQRTEDASEGVAPGPQVIRRSRQLYFPDGNIVIKVAGLPPDTLSHIYESTPVDNVPESAPGEPQPHVDSTPNAPFSLVYKVHKGVLSKQCSLFADLFGNPQVAFSESYDGTPMLALPDTWFELDDFLKTMYQPEHISGYLDEVNDERREASFQVFLAGILRMAKKYGSPTIGTIAVRHVCRLWPSNLSFWENKPLWDVRYPDPALAVRIGMDHGIHQILPIALYQLCVQFEAFDMTELNNLPPTEQAASPVYRVNFSALNGADMKGLFIGRAALYLQYDERLAQLGSLDFTSCVNRARPCLSAIKSHLHPNLVPDTVPYFNRKCAIFTFLSTVTTSISKDKNICMQCQLQGIENTKLGLWRDLPNIFSLSALVQPNWGFEY